MVSSSQTDDGTQTPSVYQVIGYPFTVSASLAAPVNVTKIALVLNYFTPDDNFVLQIRPDDGTGFPQKNASLGNASFVTPTAQGSFMPTFSAITYNFTPPATPITLQPGVKYWCAVHARSHARTHAVVRLVDATWTVIMDADALI